MSTKKRSVELRVRVFWCFAINEIYVDVISVSGRGSP